MRRFFRFLHKKNQPPFLPPSAESDAPAEFDGTYPEKYDHVVRVGVRVPAVETPELRVLLKSNSWPFREATESPEEPRVRCVRFTVHVPVPGASMGAVTEATSRLSYACAQAHIGAHIVSASRPRTPGTALLTYHVVPDVTSPSGVFRCLHKLRLRSRSQGTIRARSLSHAKEELSDFRAENPGVGREFDVTVTGPRGPVAEPVRSPLPATWEALLFLFMVAAVCTTVGLFLTVLLPEGGSPLTGTAVLATAFCFFGVWLLLRRLPEGPVNTWLPVVVTTLIPVLSVAAAHMNVYTYLFQFEIAPGDADISGYNLVLAGADSILPILSSAVIALGFFGFAYHFHLGGRGHQMFLNWLLAALIVFLYAGLSTQIITETSANTGAEHVAHYRDGGAPVEQFGIVPTPVCVDERSEIEDRFGPAPPTDRPILHFGFANDTDFLWDPEDGLTKVPSFSVPLTPVAGLDSTCPAPSENEG